MWKNSRSQRGISASLCVSTLVVILAAAARAATGGPDAFGYTFIDSLSPGGPAFVGIDISLTGTPFIGGDDVGTLPIPLSGIFTLYGDVINDVVMSSNGYISTSAASTGFDFDNDCPLPAVPGVDPGGARIYALHDDLITLTMFAQYFADCARPADNGSGPIGCTILQWDNAEHFPGGGPTFDFWTILYDNGDIVLEIGPGNPERGSGSTTGLQSSTATVGLTVACNVAMSIPDSYAVLIESPCGGAGGLAPPTIALVAAGATLINGTLGTINGMPSPAYRGGGIFSFTNIDIQAAAVVTFAGQAAVELHTTGSATISGSINMNGTNGTPSGNSMPGGDLVSGVASGGFGGRGGCRADWQNRYGQRGGGAASGFGGTHPITPSAGFDDTTGGGGGGNATAGFASDPPRSGTAPTGRGGCNNLSPLTYPLRGGAGGAGGGCDVDDPTPGPPGGNDGGAGGASGGGALRVQASGDITINATANIMARGGNGGTSTGNGGSGGGGAGGTILFIAGGNITNNGIYDLNGGLGGLIGQANATSGGGPGGAGFLGLYDADGVIAGSPTLTAPTPSPAPMPARVPVAPVTGTAPVFGPNDLRISNIDLPNASPSQPYIAEIIAEGGTGAYSFMVTAGAPPAGITLDSMTGVLSGMSTVAPPSIPNTFTVTVDDGVDTFARQFCIYTHQQSLAIATTALPDTDVSTAYSQTITTVGGTPPLIFSLIAGTLPTGLMLDTMTGVISGTTGASAEDATFGILVRGTFDQGASLTYNITVAPPQFGAGSPVAALSPAEECTSYRGALVALVGTAPFEFELIGGGLPAGLTLDPQGFVVGTPSPGTAGTYTLCLFVYDGFGFVGKGEVDLVVNSPTGAPSCEVTVPAPPSQPCSMPGLAIPDNDPMGVSSTINVAASGIITDMEVHVEIAHTFVGDLRIELTHVPSATTVVLMDRPGVPAISPTGCAEDDVHCDFSDAATYVAEDMCGAPPAVRGLTLPVDPLSAFIGSASGGIWRLTVSDNAVFDVGMLVEWCLSFTTVPVPQGGVITIAIDPEILCEPNYDVTDISFSLDGGATFMPCTPAAASPITPPAIGIATAPTTFLWNASADGVATMMLESNVVVRVTVQGTTGMSTCQTIAFVVDNQCLCGDCDRSGSLPVTVIDALIAAQISAGLVVPTALQLRCCDVNNTGTVTITDALPMAQSAAGLPVVLMCP